VDAVEAHGGSHATFPKNWSTMSGNDEHQTDATPGRPVTTVDLTMFGGHWCFYTDATGNCVRLAIAVLDGAVSLTTASGEVLRFTGTELGMLMENLDSIIDR
jgi:hypothetical protein